MRSVNSGLQANAGLGGFTGREVGRLREVLADFVEFPLVVEDCRQPTLRLGGRVPRSNPRRRAGDPAVVVDALVAEHLEVLRRMLRRSVGVIERVHQARALDGLLSRAVNVRRRGNADRFEQCRRDVDHRAELRTETALVFDSSGPRDDHPVARAAEVSVPARK